MSVFGALVNQARRAWFATRHGPPEIDAYAPAIRGAERPSPKGRRGAPSPQRTAGSSKPLHHGDDPLWCRCRPVRMLPLATPSGRSVFSRSTSSGTPSAGASSCMPPESLSNMSQRASPLPLRHGDSGSIRRMPGLVAKQRAHASRRPSDWGGSTQVDAVSLCPTSSISASASRSSPIAPILAAMAGDKQLQVPPRPASGGAASRQGPTTRKRVDAAVAGDMDPARTLFAPRGWRR